MKRLRLIVITLINIGILYAGKNAANAQVILHKFTFGVNVGVGIPKGAYAKNDSTALPVSHYTTQPGKTNDTNKLNGFAKTGFHFNVYAQYMIVGPIGIKLMIGGTKNSYDATTLTNDIDAQYYNTYHTAFDPTYTASSYYIGQYMIGPCLKLPIGKMNIEGQVLVGVVTSTYPTLTSNYSQSFTSSGITYASTSTSTTTYKSSTAFGYNINVGIEYMVATLIGLHLDAGYTGSSYSYSGSTLSTAGSTSIGTFSLPYSGSYPDNNAKTMSMGLIQITLGLSVDI